MSVVSHLVCQAAEWNVMISEIRETQSSVLGFGFRYGSGVVLKVSKLAGDEWHSGDVLEAFRADGTVRVYDSVGGAVLLERLDPGTQLVDRVREGEDDEATSILANVIRRMAHHAAPVYCSTVLDWARGFDRYLADGTFHGIPLALAEEAQEIYRSLEVSQEDTMLLHGDLHHYNVLFDRQRGWVAIDPKGVVGELEYELGAIIRNPVEKPDLFLSRQVVERRLSILTKALDLDYQRALRWSFAQAVLSAIWDVEDGFEVDEHHRMLRLATTIQTMIA